MTVASFVFVEPQVASSGIAFGNLIDLARLQAGSPSAEICEACNTINLGSARLCKCCTHKLPAFYAAGNAARAEMQSDELHTVPKRAWALDFAAFWIVINALMIITRFIPVP